MIDAPNKSSAKSGSGDGPDTFLYEGIAIDKNLPRVTVGVRFHDVAYLHLLKRCIQCIGAQKGVQVHLDLALQGFDKTAFEKVRDATQVALDGSGFSFGVHNEPNPHNKDLRSCLLNRIVARHYDGGQSTYLCFIDFDDVWFEHALETLAETLQITNTALSYADIHCADIYVDSEQTYLRGIKDVYGISKKVKRNLLTGNFLPLHSYMFDTTRIDSTVLRYDESLDRLEDFDVLLSVAHSHPISGLYRKRLIGLYNFYETASGGLNSSNNVFHRIDKPAEDWGESMRRILVRHSGTPWKEFWGEDWQM